MQQQGADDSRQLSVCVHLCAVQNGKKKKLNKNMRPVWVSFPWCASPWDAQQPGLSQTFTACNG